MTVADGVPDAAAKAGMEPLQFVVANEATLRPTLNRLGEKHFDNLKTIAGGETIIGRTVPPKHAEVSPAIGAVEAITGSSPRTLYSQSANAAAGRQSYVSAGLHLLSRFGIKTSEERVADIMREIIYNPELAKRLSDAAKQPVTSAASNRIRDHLINAGIRVGATANQ